MPKNRAVLCTACLQNSWIYNDKYLLWAETLWTNMTSFAYLSIFCWKCSTQISIGDCPTDSCTDEELQEVNNNCGQSGGPPQCIQCNPESGNVCEGLRCWRMIRRHPKWRFFPKDINLGLWSQIRIGVRRWGVRVSEKFPWPWYSRNNGRARPGGFGTLIRQKISSPKNRDPLLLSKSIIGRFW